MKIELTQEHTFTARSGQHLVHGLHITSEWEGLRKLVDKTGRHMIVDTDGMVLKGTPALLHDLRLTVGTDLFVTVPETTLPNGTVVPAFQVGQYHCSQGEGGKLAVNATGKPWVRINYADARQVCLDAGYALLTELQALAIAHNIAQQGANWSGGQVGEGTLLQGLHLDLDDVNEPYAGDFVSRDPSERRMFVLSNGQTICDAAGNVFSWVFDDVQGDESGLVARAFAADSPSITTAPFPSMERGMGWYPKAGSDWSGYALIRGGYWCSVGHAGVFNLDRGWPDYAYDYVGFRCTKPIGL